jgi:peptidyl-prolyl cis-trans isomerase C
VIRAALLVAMVLSVCACGGKTAPIPPKEGPLEDGVAARVGDTKIPVAAVARIAAAQRISPKEARDRAIRDALFASAARAEKLDADVDARARIDALLARKMMESFVADAAKAGPPTDAEVAEATLQHWVDLDRPESFRTAHVVVRFEENSPPDKRKRGTEIADQIRSLMEPISASAKAHPLDLSRAPDQDELFLELKRISDAQPKEGFELRAESLPPVVPDGRLVVPGVSMLDVDFARAAGQLRERGQLAPVTVSKFGAHVILLLQRIEGASVPLEARRDLLRTEIFTARARSANEALLAPLRKPVALDRNVDSILALIVVDQ